MSEKALEKGFSFSGILANPQYIHMFVEVIVIAGVVIYFSKTVKTLNNKVDILAHKIEEQQAIISNHEDVIKKLVESVQNLNSQILLLKQANMVRDFEKDSVKDSVKDSKKFFTNPTRKPNVESKNPKLSTKSSQMKNPSQSVKKTSIKKNVKNIDEIAESFASALPTMFAYQFDTGMKKSKVMDAEEIEEEFDSELKEEELEKNNEESEKEEIEEEIEEEIDFDKELEAELEEFK